MLEVVVGRTHAPSLSEPRSAAPGRSREPLTMITQRMKAGIIALRPFVPARDHARSRAFYEALGFEAFPLGEQMTSFHVGNQPGAFAFLLQQFDVKEFAENYMMHLLVDDLDAWWTHIDGLSLDTRFAVRPPRMPKLEPWGLRVCYVWDPSEVLWHFAAEAEPDGP
jgi:hypothetical protein